VNAVATDLFFAAARAGVPAYGSLRPSDELALYYDDNATWCDYVAPATAAKLAAGGVAAVRAAWPCMSDTYRAAVWRQWTPEQQQHLARHGIAAPVPS